jgi:hypothetical protein
LTGRSRVIRLKRTVGNVSMQGNDRGAAMGRVAYLLAAVLAAAASMPAGAALLSRDLNGDSVVDAYYDDVLKVTWLKDANLAASTTFGVSGIFLSGPSAGVMSWETAQRWIAAMNAASYLGYRDWRLPDLSPLNGVAFDTTFSVDGSSDLGINVTARGTLYAGSTASELAYMYYQNLGNSGYYLPSGALSGCWASAFDTCLDNEGPFNLPDFDYWFGRPFPRDASEAWAFAMSDGAQGPEYVYNYGGAWAVRTGDVTPVPEPAVSWLVALGLIGLGALAPRVARRRV